ncbi:hypothetical protein JAAARDRAFT_32912 [Jaapia argillacea MUCL 33604]|uniref:HpcH/HpaI aldolase/citrate lyase domain-containing protein n=1 Tax=Jaapia argillacea MUCL 33604 TaxID=933084 RepID=A0A067QD36_9AGAM|nr:hypothetical protein JAAARDRAFT_32912 [Jaapia argillacea MUCL 33604]
MSHPLLTAIKSNKPAFGAWITLPGVFNLRTVAQASPHLSWVLVDCEHGLTSLVPGAAEAMQTLAGVGRENVDAPSAIVRIPATGFSSAGGTGMGWQIKYALDAGARGILVPMVGSEEKAREIAAEARFPPIGRRGFGSPFTNGTWGISPGDYLGSANESVVVMVQIETKEGVENMESIIKVDGIDALFIGPYDLSISLGFPPPSPDPHPEVEKVIQKILGVAHAAQKKCAIYCTSGSQSALRAKQGFDIISVTTDVGALSEAIAKNLAEAAGVGQEKKGFSYS